MNSSEIIEEILHFSHEQNIITDVLDLSGEYLKMGFGLCESYEQAYFNVLDKRGLVDFRS